jgi:hypothetical protein
MSQPSMLLFVVVVTYLIQSSLQVFREPVSTSIWGSGAVHEILFDNITGLTGYIELVRDDNTLVGPGKLFRTSFDSGKFLFPLFFSAKSYKARFFLCPEGYCKQGKQGTVENPFLASELFTVEKKSLPLASSQWYGLLLQGRECRLKGKGIEGRFMTLKWNDDSVTMQLDSDQPHEITYWRPTTSQTTFYANYLGELYCFYIDESGNFRRSTNPSKCPTLDDHAKDCDITISSADLSRDPYQYKWNPIPRGEYTGGLQLIKNSFDERCFFDTRDIIDLDTVIVSDKWDLQINTLDTSQPNLLLKYIRQVKERPGFYYGIQDGNNLLTCFNVSHNVIELQLRPGGNCSDHALAAAPHCSADSIAIRFYPRSFAPHSLPGWATFLIVSFLFLSIGGVVFGILGFLYFKKWRNRNTYEVFTSNTKNYWTTIPDSTLLYQNN